MLAAARETAAALGALATYGVAVLPSARRQLRGWREQAAAIPDPELRAAALGAIDEKGSNVEATAVFAILAPPRARPAALRAMVALQAAIDFLDTIEEQGGERSDDGALYLERLFTSYREAVTALPSAAVIAPALERAVARCGEGQVRTHAAATAGGDALRHWAQSLAAPGVYRWWEVAAGASSSVAAHALIALSAEPAATAAEAAAVDAAYFPAVGCLTVLLDDLLDREADAAAAEHNYLSYYAGPEQAAHRLSLIAGLARARLADLRHPARQRAILAGVSAFYLGGPGLDGHVGLVRRRLFEASGPATRTIARAVRARRRLQG